MSWWKRRKMANSLDDFERGILDNVRDFGCQVNTVVDPDENDPPFSYSVGFPETLQQDEVIIFGLSPQMMNWMINELLRRCREGLVLEDGMSLDGLLQGFSCIARGVHPSWIVRDYFNSAMWYHKHRTGEMLQGAMQIFWPGKADGLYPWEGGSDPYVRSLQPALYEPRAVA